MSRQLGIVCFRKSMIMSIRYSTEIFKHKVNISNIIPFHTHCLTITAASTEDSFIQHYMEPTKTQAVKKKKN